MSRPACGAHSQNLNNPLPRTLPTAFLDLHPAGRSLRLPIHLQPSLRAQPCLPTLTSYSCLHSFQVGDDDEDAEPELAMQLVFAHTPSYPDEPPCMRLRSVRGLGDAELAEATAELQQHITDSMGMAMIYNLVTAAQEWLAGEAKQW
jgi:hypothetical protein